MSEREEIVLWNEGGTNAIYGEKTWWGEDEEQDYGRAEFEQFVQDFAFLGYRHLADPDEDWYQGVNFMSVWQRKSDGKYFGFQYWESVSKHGEPYLEEGTDWDDEKGTSYTFKEVEPFQVIGYKFRE